jgi:hypothetical protein
MPSEETRICEWCGNPYTFIRTGHGRPPPYCSDACRHEAENSIEAARMRRTRQQQREADPYGLSRRRWDDHASGEAVSLLTSAERVSRGGWDPAVSCRWVSRSWVILASIRC